MIKGTKHSEETKTKISESRKGTPAWNKGIPSTVEAKEKNRLAHTGRIPNLKQLEALRLGHGWNKGLSPSDGMREKLRKFNTGKKHSFETKLLLSELFSGANNPHWKGGISGLKKVIRGSLLYRQWRSDIFNRDDFTCRVCFTRGGELNADHHPKTFSSILTKNNIQIVDDAVKCSELWDINNGRTLCVGCHRKHHSENEKD